MPLRLVVLLLISLVVVAEPVRAQDAFALRAALLGAGAPDTTATVGLVAEPDEPRLRNMPPDEPQVPRVALVAGTLAGASVALHLWQQNAWWADEHRTSFHFHDDGGYALHLDKVAHFHATALQAGLITRSFRWAGLSDNASALWGTLGALALQTHVEIEDGYNALWGFDRLDMLANILGAGYFYAHQRLDVLDPITLKWSYWPSRVMRGRSPASGGTVEDRPNSFIDDYEGQTFWVSVRVHAYLPETAQRFWPEWLTIAGGLSGRYLQTDHARREVFLSLDVDLTRLFPAETWLGQQLRETFNFLHLPAPALRISPRLTPFALYYGQ